LNAINDPTHVASDNHALMCSGANINGIVLLKHKRDSLGVNPFVCIDLNEHLRRPFALRKTDSGYGSRPAALEYSKTDSAGGLRIQDDAIDWTVAPHRANADPAAGTE
jgi:hypothetical protein